MASTELLESFKFDPKFAGLDIFQANYKQVGDHGIRVDVFVPKTPSANKRPIFVRFHGGGLVMGDSLYKDFWPQWLSDLALQKNAIVISPNYRLMPQATGLDIYDDIEDFWAWVLSGAVNELLTKHGSTEADLSRILVGGESAGGLLSVNSALAHAADIRAAVATYPSVDPTAADFVVPRSPDRLPFGQHVPASVVEERLAEDSTVPVSSAISPKEFPFMLAMVEYGHYGEWYVRGSEGPRQNLLFPERRLEEPDVKVPAGGITIIQGRQDSIVPAHHSEPFVARAREVLKGKPGGDKIAFIVKDGEHGFDVELKYEEPWLKEALQTAVDAWLA
ncbi:Alpha/Beta hydrolase protein [Aspergillus unguis]